MRRSGRAWVCAHIEALQCPHAATRNHTHLGTSFTRRMSRHRHQRYGQDMAPGLPHVLPLQRAVAGKL